MQKLKEVLRLRYELGLGQRQIARSCSIGHGTVSDYLKRAEAAGVTWPLAEGWDDRQLEAALFGGTPRRSYETQKSQPDFAQLHEELQRHPHLTLQLAWEEYRQAYPDGYAYSRFCELYQRWRQRLDVVLRQEHKAGEKLFVDYAGATIPISDPQGGPERPASIFVAVLGASNYTYAEATASQELEHWTGSHIRAFEFLGGVPQLVIPDNTRTGVNRACRYEPDLNRTYHELAMHYGVGVLPTRPYKPRDKAKVETGVQIVQRWIVAALRHRKFFSLAELNQAIRELLTPLNQRPFQRKGSGAFLPASRNHFLSRIRNAAGFHSPKPASTARHHFDQPCRADGIGGFVPSSPEERGERGQEPFFQFPGTIFFRESETQPDFIRPDLLQLPGITLINHAEPAA